MIPLSYPICSTAELICLASYILSPTVTMPSLLSTVLSLPLFLATTTSLSLRAPYASAPTANVKNGLLVGRHSDTYNQDFFLGIPYAKPPVGELRLKNPAPYDEEFDKAGREVKEYGSTCIGYGVGCSRQDDDGIS